MEELQVGHYWIALLDFEEAVHSRFDGKNFYHERGRSHPRHVKVLSQDSIPPQCGPLCHCTQNPDGTWTSVCS
jgi:hypothetical protein